MLVSSYVHPVQKGESEELEKKAVLGITLTLFLIGMSTFAFNIQPVKTDPTTIIVPDDYSTIQAAINAANLGDIIHVEKGIYIEHVNVNKSYLTLIGEDPKSTIINGNGTGTGIYIRATNVIISGFTIQNAADGVTIGRIPHPAANNVISGNIISRIRYNGILAYAAGGPPTPRVFTNNTIISNLITNSSNGIVLTGSGTNNTISKNVVTSSDVGMVLEDVGNNTVADNLISGNTFGMLLASSNNLFRNNTMADNQYNFISDIYFFDTTLVNDVDTSNTVNGKPIYFFTNKSNMVIDPSHFPDIGYLNIINCYNMTIQNLTLGSNGLGMLISDSIDVTVKGNTLKGNMNAFFAKNVNSTAFENNTIIENLYGASFGRGFNNTIVNNTFRNNTLRLLPYRWPQKLPPHPLDCWITDELSRAYSGSLLLYASSNNTIANNIFLNNEQGITLSASSFNTLKNNTLAENVYNIGIDPLRLFPREWVGDPPEPPRISPYFINDVDTSNTVNGKPIYWWINRHDEQVPIDAGYVVLVNSTNIVVSNLVLQNNTQGIFLVDVNNTVISNNVITSTRYGITIRPTFHLRATSVNNTITQNNITKSGVGIYSTATDCIISYNLIAHNLAGIFDRGSYNSIIGNIIRNNTSPPREEYFLGFIPFHWVMEVLYYHLGAVGVILENADNNTICCNTIQNNDYGMSIGFVTGLGRNNKIYHNNFINNTEHLEGRRPFWYEHNLWDDGYPSGGNYWSDYEEKYPNAKEMDGSGIWDTPYFIDDRNQDNYPLMEPWSPKPPSPTEALEELIHTVESWNLHAGIENSLTSKLQAAHRSLERETQKTSIRQIQAFINHVEALQPKKLTNEQADYLVSEAQGIIDLIQE